MKHSTIIPLIFFISIISVVNLFSMEKVVIKNVHDGDTITIKYLDGEKKGRVEQVHLFGIDAPELDQAYGFNAKQHLISNLRSIDIKFKMRSKNLDSQPEGVLYVDGVNINDKMVENGYAWQNKRYSTNSELNDMYLKARDKKIGLWNDKQEPIPPWVFRSYEGKSKHPAINTYIPYLIICKDDITSKLTYYSIDKVSCPKGTKALIR